MSSQSDSDSDSNRSINSLHQGPAPTPGHGLDRSASNSPQFRQSREGSAERARSQTSRSRSGSAASSARSRSRSGSPGSQKSGDSRKSRSRSVASNRSRRSQSANSNRSGSGSAKSNRSGSQTGSHRSSSGGSKKSHSRSRSGSVTSNRTRSRSGSAASNRSGSKSPSRSRSGSDASRRSPGAESNRSKSRSSSRGKEEESRGQSRSKSNSPNLQIDEPASPEIGQNNETEERPKKKSRIIDTDSEEEEKVREEVSAAAIFGDADDISSEEEKDKEGGESDRERQRSEDERHHSGEENEERRTYEYEDKEAEPEPIPETRIDVEIPKISCDLGRDIHFVKLPNFLSVETRPFDPETYEDEIDEEETLDEEGRARLKLKVENTIRWKDVLDDDGNMSKLSNARLVRWSDGSYSLHLGSEIFDVYKQPLQGDHNHLFIRQGTGLQGQAVFRTKLSFRPHSTESFTHRKMTLSLADRSQKTSGIKILSQVGADPDQDRAVLLKKEEEKLRQTVRVSKPRRKGDSSRSHNTSSYREEDGSDEDGAISLNAIKNKYKSGAAAPAKGGAIYSSDEEGSDIEARRARKLDKAKVLKDSDSSEESE